MGIINIFIVMVIAVLVRESSELIANRSRRSETCGVSKSEEEPLTNEQDVTRGAFPWIVALMHAKINPPELFCGGTLVSQTFVVSAAHCILPKAVLIPLFPRDILALFGAHELSNPFEASRVALSPKKVIMHDDWSALTSQYDADISLLEFEKGSINFNFFIQPICLWNSAKESTGIEGIVSGWGKSAAAQSNTENIPKLIKVPIRTNGECFSEAKALVDLSSSRTFCGLLRNDSVLCKFDSGGGLFFKENGVYHLKGILSSPALKDGECAGKKSIFFTDVPKFGKWIQMNKRVVKKLFCSIETNNSTLLNRTVDTCQVKQAIANDDYVLGSPINSTVELFLVTNQTEVKFLPELIGEKFPNLKLFVTQGCDLMFLRHGYFKNMGNLQFLFLDSNKIATIEAGTFNGLANVEKLHLDNNMIEAFDEQLFITMVNLKEITLTKNNIKTMSSSGFNIPGGKLSHVDLRENVCINQNYRFDTNWKELETDIRNKCANNMLARDVQEVLCSYIEYNSPYSMVDGVGCYVNQTIDSNDYYVLKSPMYNNIEVFGIKDNKEAKYLPRHLGVKFPNLKYFLTVESSLTVLHDKYFEKMNNLLMLDLHSNEILYIEPFAFKDLVSLEYLNLENNWIQTFDEKLFSSMANLIEVVLSRNQIKFLSQSTFPNRSGKLLYVDLIENICINQNYRLDTNWNELESDLKNKCSRNALVFLPQDFKEVSCIFIEFNSSFLMRNAVGCDANQSIESEDFYVLESPMYNNIEVFEIKDNKEAQYLPRHIGVKFPNLKEFWTINSGLTVVRDHYFKNMQNLNFLDLNSNQLENIESGAFKDLISLEMLNLENNGIQTLYEKLFSGMVKLKEVNLDRNKIKHIRPETFKIPGGKLTNVVLRENVCINQNYRSDTNLMELEGDLKNRCGRNAMVLSAKDMREVFCSFFEQDSPILKKVTIGCYVNQNISSNDFYVLESPKYNNVELFQIKENIAAKYLPRLIGRKFPNLKEFSTVDSGLTVVRNQDFKDMQNLNFLDLNNNQIRYIESDAFKDLISLETLNLNNNYLQTLDEKLFSAMIDLKTCSLKSNRINFLTPTTFKISGASLKTVILEDNDCINKNYGSDHSLDKLESDLRTECKRVQAYAAIPAPGFT